MLDIKVVKGSGRSEKRGITSLFFRQKSGKWVKPYRSCTIHGLKEVEFACHLWAELLIHPKIKPIIAEIYKKYKEEKNGRTN